MAEIITPQEVATWARRDVSTFGAFETMVIDETRLLVAGVAEHPEWVTDDVEVPHRARVIALNVAKRTITNPDQVVQEGSIGPIGGDRVREEAALALQLSDAERDELLGLRGEPGEINGLWTLSTNADRSFQTVTYVADDSGSDWMIPFATTGDVGEPDALGEY